jgi:drug/metabolite transporter (DMT)-like permease
VLGLTANLMFLPATAVGALTVSSVLTALYPAVTVALAAAFLHERPGPVQLAGLTTGGLAVTAIVVG